MWNISYLTSNSSPGVAEVRLGKWTVEEGSVDDMVGCVLRVVDVIVLDVIVELGCVLVRGNAVSKAIRMMSMMSRWNWQKISCNVSRIVQIWIFVYIWQLVKRDMVWS